MRTRFRYKPVANEPLAWLDSMQRDTRLTRQSYAISIELTISNLNCALVRLSEEQDGRFVVQRLLRKSCPRSHQTRPGAIPIFTICLSLGNCIVAASVLRGNAMCTYFGANCVNRIAVSIAIRTALVSQSVWRVIGSAPGAMLLVTH